MGAPIVPSSQSPPRASSLRRGGRYYNPNLGARERNLTSGTVTRVTSGPALSDRASTDEDVGWRFAIGTESSEVDRMRLPMIGASVDRRPQRGRGPGSER